MPKTLNTTDLLNKMTSITARYVKTYQTDFTEYDAPEIRKISENGEKAEYLWFVREHGTYFIDLSVDNKEGRTFLKTIREHYPTYREYTLTFGGEFWTIRKTGGKIKEAA